MHVAFMVAEYFQVVKDRWPCPWFSRTDVPKPSIRPAELLLPPRVFRRRRPSSDFIGRFRVSNALAIRRPRNAKTLSENAWNRFAKETPGQLLPVPQCHPFKREGKIAEHQKQ